MDDTDEHECQQSAKIFVEPRTTRRHTKKQKHKKQRELGLYGHKKQGTERIN